MSKTFQQYFYEKPLTDLPVNQSDYILVMENSIVKKVQISSVPQVLFQLSPIEIDTSAGDVIVSMPTQATHASYVQATDDGNEVSFTTSDGSNIAEQGLVLNGQFQRITFDRTGDTWYRG